MSSYTSMQPDHKSDIAPSLPTSFEGLEPRLCATDHARNVPRNPTNDYAALQSACDDFTVYHAPGYSLGVVHAPVDVAARAADDNDDVLKLGSVALRSPENDLVIVSAPSMESAVDVLHDAMVSNSQTMS